MHDQNSDIWLLGNRKSDPKISGFSHFCSSLNNNRREGRYQNIKKITKITIKSQVPKLYPTYTYPV